MMATARHLEVVWWDGSVVGHLVSRGSVFFVYDEAWLRRGHNLSPLGLPFTSVAFNGARGIDGVPGLIADCLPDSWGRKVARMEFARRRWGEPDTLSLLAWRGANGLGALQFRPALGEDGRALSRELEAISLEALARGAAAIERGAASTVLPQLARGGTAGGAFPKALVLDHGDGSFSTGAPCAGARPCLVKFDIAATGSETRCEHAYARMAAASGIRAVTTKLVAESTDSGRRHLLVSRFDVPDPENPKRRVHFHSLAGILQQPPGALDYRDFFRAAVRLGLSLADVREIARRMVFNVLASNADDHGKNHAFLYDEADRKWSLTPAYDMTYNPMMLERGMTVLGEVWPSRRTMEALCAEVGIAAREFESILEGVQSGLARWSELARKAGVPSALRKEIALRQERIHGAAFADQGLRQQKAAGTDRGHRR